MAEVVTPMEVLATRKLLAGLELQDREWGHQVATSQRFTEGCNINHLEQQRAVVETTPREARSNVETLTGYSQGSQMHDLARYKDVMDNNFYGGGMKSNYANQNPKPNA